MRIPIIFLCCLCTAACATRSPADGSPPGRNPDGIYVGPPIYGALEDRMQSPNSAEEAPQEAREEDWPAGRFGLNWRGLKIMGGILIVAALMQIALNNSHASIGGGSSGGGGGNPLPWCEVVSNPSPGFNCR